MDKEKQRLLRELRRVNRENDVLQACLTILTFGYIALAAIILL